MYFRIRILVVFIVTVLALPTIGMASVIFQPGKKAKYVVPGEEEISGNAAELFQIGQTAEKEGNPKRAIKAYKSLVKRHPRDTLAAGALFRAAELQEQVTIISERQNRFANWWKNTLAVRTSMKQSRVSFASGKSI